jgi:hypothetical protein
MTDVFAPAASQAPKTPSVTAAAFDNFLRRALKLNDPRDPNQVARGLLELYPDEAAKERFERQGLPYLSAASYAPVQTSAIGAAGMELAQARDDLERDLLSLTSSSQLKDIAPELAGWARSVRQIAANGLAAARLPLDALNFDQALTARRRLGEFALLARYVGTLSDGCGAYFRRFAQSLDVLGGLLLVAIGEGFAAAGVTRSTSIVRVSSGALQMRRNAVINALRSLTGSLLSTGDQEQYPRGLEAYRSLADQLEDDAQADLSALLEENALAQAMDDLIELSTGSSIESLRELTTASAFVVQRFDRLIQYAEEAGGTAKSPPLATFMSALRLFVDAFTTSGSNRLLFIARPPITAYGLYGVGGPDVGGKQLIELATLRGSVVEEIDCFAGCGCDEETLRCQILLDHLLFALDRAIDLYAVGTDPDAKGDPEARAAVTGIVIDNLLTLPVLVDAAAPDKCVISKKLKAALEGVRDCLLRPFPVPRTNLKPIVDRELRIAYRAEEQMERLVRSLSPSCQTDRVFNSKGLFPKEDESPIRALFSLIVNGEMKFSDGDEIPDTPAFSMAMMVRKLDDIGGPPPPSSYSPPPPPPPTPYSPPPPPHGAIPPTPPPPPPVMVAQQAPAAGDTAPSSRSIESAMLCMNAVTPGGKINPATPYGSVLTKSGYTSLAAIRAVGAKQDFISSVRSCLQQASTHLAEAISDAGLGHFFDIAPHLEAAPATKKTP